MRYSFFAGSRPNYGRWIVRYNMNLLNIDKTHPGVREVLQSHWWNLCQNESYYYIVTIYNTQDEQVILGFRYSYTLFNDFQHHKLDLALVRRAPV